MDLSKLVTAEDKTALAAESESLALKDIISVFKDEREIVLNRLSGIGFAARINGQADVVQNVLYVRQGLLDLTHAKTVMSATTQELLHAAIQEQCLYMLQDSPPEIRSAFKEILA